MVIESLHVGTPVLVSGQVELAKFVKEENMGWVTSLAISNVVKYIKIAINNEAARERIALEGPSIIKKLFAADKLIM